MQVDSPEPVYIRSVKVFPSLLFTKFVGVKGDSGVTDLKKSIEAVEEQRRRKRLRLAANRSEKAASAPARLSRHPFKPEPEQVLLFPPADSGSTACQCDSLDTFGYHFGCCHQTAKVLPSQEQPAEVSRSKRLHVNFGFQSIPTGTAWHNCTFIVKAAMDLPGQMTGCPGCALPAESAHWFTC